MGMIFPCVSHRNGDASSILSTNNQQAFLTKIALFLLFLPSNCEELEEHQCSWQRVGEEGMIIQRDGQMPIMRFGKIERDGDIVQSGMEKSQSLWQLCVCVGGCSNLNHCRKIQSLHKLSQENIVNKSIASDIFG